MIPRPENEVLGYFLYSSLLDRPDMTYGDGAKRVQVKKVHELTIIRSEDVNKSKKKSTRH